MTLSEFRLYLQELLAQQGLRVYRSSATTFDVELFTNNHDQIDTFEITVERA